MSLQDDYYDLEESLSGENLKAFNRIWFAFCDLETAGMVRNGEMTAEDYTLWRDQRIKELNF